MIDYSVIPKSWKPLKLGEVCKVRNGYAFKSVDFKNSGVLLFRQTNLDGENVKLKNSVYLPEAYLEKYQEYQILKGDVLVGMSGSIGKMCVYNLDKPALQNQRTGLLRFTDLVEKKYIRYYFEVLEQVFIKKSKGVAVLNISAKDIQESEFHLPSIPEQQAIVAKIEELLSELENGKQQLLTAQQQLKVYRQSLLKWAFEGKLTNKDVKDGELPKGWKWVKNKELLKYVTSGSRDWKQYYSNKGSRFVRTQDINSNKLDLANSAYMDLPEKVEGKRSLIEEGDILMTITGANVGKVAVVDFPIEDAYVSQSVALLKYQDKRITKFLWYFFQAQGFGKSFIDKLVYGVGRPVLSLENMREVDVISCPIEDQQEIIDELESKLTVCDKIEETISQSLQQAETLRQSILKKAFEGNLL